jgi:hypothetical protein
VNFNEYRNLDLNPKMKKKYKTILVPIDMVQKCYVEAEKRRRLHKNHASQRIYNKQAEFIGLLGECGFAIEKHSKVDWTLRLGGDKYDFKFSQAYIDVKSTEKRKGVSIRKEVFHDNPNFIYVMTKCNEKKRSVTLVGWIRGNEVNSKIKDIYYDDKNNPDDIYVPENHFKDMSSLDNAINEINVNPNKENYYKV